MAIDFPDSPSLNEIYSSGGKSWVWNGSVWKQGLGSYSQVGHTHSAEDVTSGIFSIDRIPTTTGSVSSNYVVRSDDARLTDSRTPTSHTHSISEVTNLQTSLDAKGTVSSVAVSGGTTGLTTSGGPITTSGTITIAGTLSASNGGTGQTSYTIGDLLYASTSSAISKLAGVATGNALISGGVGAAPSYGKVGLTTHVNGTLAVTNGGTGATTLTGVVKGNGTSAMTAGTVSLTSEISGTLPLGNGGTGQTSAQAAINSLAGATTSGQFLRGNGSNVVMSAIQASDVPTLNQNTTGTASNVTGTVAVANGGTGATSLTANSIVMGNGTSAVQLIAPGSSGNVITSNGTTWTSAAPAITLAGNNTWTGLQTFAGSATNLDIKLSSALEAISVIALSASGTINFDVISQSVLYYTSNSSANWTLNIRGNSSTSLTSLMSAGESLTIVFLATNSGTAYRQTSLTIDGNSITPKWLGGSAPSTGNANSIDAYTITLIKTGTSSFTVLESQSKFA